jgi:dihydrofolate reductase
MISFPLFGKRKEVLRMITILVARSRNGVIGNKGDVPWDLPADRLHFKDKTKGKIVVVGRITEESIERRLKKPLPGRKTLILTTKKNYKAPSDECQVITNFRRILALSRHKEVFVIGGQKIYSLFLEYAQRLLITEVDADVQGDTFFPMLDMSIWQEKSRTSHPADEKNHFPFSIVEYIRQPRL